MIICGILNDWLNQIRILNGTGLWLYFLIQLHSIFRHTAEHMPASMAINAIIIEEYSRTLTWWDNYNLSCVFFFSENYFQNNKKNIYQRDTGKKSAPFCCYVQIKKDFFCCWSHWTRGKYEQWQEHPFLPDVQQIQYGKEPDFYAQRQNGWGCV